MRCGGDNIPSRALNRALLRASELVRAAHSIIHELARADRVMGDLGATVASVLWV